MEKGPEEGILFKTSRISYIHNYFLIALLAVIMLIIFPSLNIFGNMLHYIIFFGILVLIAGLWEEPEWERMFRKYIITDNEIIKLDGLIRKKKMILPYQSIADVRIAKGVIGRIFDYGTVDVVGFKDGITMKGIKNPEKIQKIIQGKMSAHKGGSLFKQRK